MLMKTLLIFFQIFVFNHAQDDFFKGSTIYDDLLRAGLIYRNQFSLPKNQIHQISPNEINLKAKFGNNECGIVPETCPKSIYRSYDGSCNNLKHPSWGTPNTPYNRLLPANYADGIKEPPLSKSGKPLPLARSISLLLYPNIPNEDHVFTLNVMQFGQIVTHDLSMTAGSTQTQYYKDSCCSADGQLLDPSTIPAFCYPMIIPPNDPAHANDNTRCMSFDRTVTNKDRQCVSERHTAEQLTSVNHYLDLSFVYGNDDETNRKLREFQHGRLRADIRNGYQWLPRATNASGTCRLINPNDACYVAGDTRLNQNPQLAILHTVFLREHNRIAHFLSHLNPHWDDELVFQESRKINIAQYQQITCYEWLPYIIGEENAYKARILWKTDGFIDDYDENVDATVLNEHSTAALRHFHSLVRGQLHLIKESRYSEGTVRFSDVLGRPQIIEEHQGFDHLMRGLTTQPQSASDQFHTSEITQFLFRSDNETFGVDLKAFDVQRSRDHGLASYNDYRELWKIPRARKFEDFLDFISYENVDRLARLYEHPDDVDLTVGGSLETNLPGALVGPTFLGIIAESFYRTRVGDRFWFENGGPSNFNPDQLREIRKARMAKLLCDNANAIRTMQLKGFEKLSSSNPLIPCQSLPSIDLSLWKEDRGNDPVEYVSLIQKVFDFK
ncbi:unnamed protein product [Phyllotreta striolata]|uniref:Uncharacterized protein n=1 Tax=Phyllotreta striolata TaxID=444603 RepID=A0A9N9XN53_PHYSR|nr:unnamed protein product [Phyllotreta striolata]